MSKFRWSVVSLFVFLGCASTPKPMTAALPMQLAVPGDQQSVLRTSAKGDQVYQCVAKASGGSEWKLQGPDAVLFNSKGEVIGKHYAGPTWEASDGSKVVAAVAAQAPSPDPSAVAWLLLKAKSHEGTGIFGRVSYVQRINTSGGKPVPSECDAARNGTVTPVHYTAEYVFYAPVN